MASASETINKEDKRPEAQIKIRGFEWFSIQNTPMNLISVSPSG
jgi:hypothetical protein